MLDLYKRYIFWQLRWMARVPGLRTYSRWVTRQYERRFWLTHILMYASAIAQYLALVKIAKLIEERRENAMWEQYLEEEDTLSKAHV